MQKNLTVHRLLAMDDLFFINSSLVLYQEMFFTHVKITISKAFKIKLYIFFPMDSFIITLQIINDAFSCDFLELKVVKKQMSEKQFIAIHFQSIGKSL